MSTAWFRRALLPWYREHHRPLPWRANRNPYRIWLSEVILQQTRVEQGLAYWHRFVERYPSAAELAKAPEDEVLRLWQGLGYYSRARNLRTAAAQLMERHGGAFPPEIGALRALKGVGDYTAAAIGSIAFGLVEPAVDGNVYRVLARVFGISTPMDSTAGRKEFRALAARLMDKEQPGDHNQAVMELGALVCTPKSPHCGECPVANKCIARRTQRISELPVKVGRIKVRERHFNYLYLSGKPGTFLIKRTGKDIWQGLYELPLIESPEALAPNRFMNQVEQHFGPGWKMVKKHGPVNHVLSHQVIQARFWEVVPPVGFTAPEGWIAVRPDTIDRYALPRLIERYLRRTSPE